MWNAQRIEKEHGLKEKYGLKNLRELWKTTTEVSRIRRNARDILSNRVGENVGSDMIARLERYSIVGSGAKIDDLLGVTPESILNRRLQSVVFRLGLAKTHKQARQLITHGFISINGRKVKSPGYMVKSDEEQRISYYKPINLNPAQPEPTAKVKEEAARPEEKPDAEIKEQAAEKEG